MDSVKFGVDGKLNKIFSIKNSIPEIKEYIRNIYFPRANLLHEIILLLFLKGDDLQMMKSVFQTEDIEIYKDEIEIYEDEINISYEDGTVIEINEINTHQNYLRYSRYSEEDPNADPTDQFMLKYLGGKMVSIEFCHEGCNYIIEISPSLEIDSFSTKAFDVLQQLPML